MNFKEYLNEAKIIAKFDSSRTSLAKRFDKNDSINIISALKQNKSSKKIAQEILSIEQDSDYSLDLKIILDNGDTFTLYAKNKIISLGGNTSGYSKNYEIAAITAEELIKELGVATIK